MNLLPKIKLIALGPAHVDDFMVWASDDQVTEFLLWDSYRSKEQALHFLNTCALSHPWMKAIIFQNKAVGAISLDQGMGKYSCKAELGYVIARAYWGRGIATAAVLETLKKAFSELNMARIEAYIDPTNLASACVMLKCGFKLDGFLEKVMIQKQKVKDRLLYSYNQ